MHPRLVDLFSLDSIVTEQNHYEAGSDILNPLRKNLKIFIVPLFLFMFNVLQPSIPHLLRHFGLVSAHSSVFWEHKTKCQPALIHVFHDLAWTGLGTRISYHDVCQLWDCSGSCCWISVLAVLGGISSVERPLLVPTILSLHNLG